MMDVPLVVGNDLVATHRGCRRLAGGVTKPVAAIYHRYSPEYLDPLVNATSMIGVPFLFAAWRAGALALVNAPSCCVADDKSLFSFVPDIIRYYLGEEPALQQPPTLSMRDP